MELLIVTGMSGAGKSQAVQALEDIGFYCVDNVPPSLLASFADLSRGQLEHIALVVDVRSHSMFADLEQRISELRAADYRVRILFLDCADHVLAQRYKETRRRHPLAQGNDRTTMEAIAEERIMLEGIRNQADYLIDTTMLAAARLRERVRELFGTETGHAMSISCTSFGFKNGLPRDSDLVFDVRCLENPYYVPELRERTGLEEPVREYVLKFPAAKQLLDKLKDLFDFLLPLYIKEGKSQLVISFGCTGGKHRSVVFAEEIAKHLRAHDVPVTVSHRDIQRH